MGSIPWELVIPIVIELIKGCREDAGEAKVAARLQNPGPRERWALRRALVEKTELRGRQLRQAVAEGMEMLRDDSTLGEDLLAAAEEA